MVFLRVSSTAGQSQAQGRKALLPLRKKTRMAEDELFRTSNIFFSYGCGFSKPGARFTLVGDRPVRWEIPVSLLVELIHRLTLQDFTR